MKFALSSAGLLLFATAFIAIATCMPAQACDSCGGDRHATVQVRTAHIIYVKRSTDGSHKISTVETAPVSCCPAPKSCPDKTPTCHVRRLQGGDTITVRGRFFGNEPGAVDLVVKGVTGETEIVQWSATSITFTVPKLLAPVPTPAKLKVIRDNGTVAKEMCVTFCDEDDFGVVRRNYETVSVAPAAHLSSNDIRLDGLPEGAIVVVPQD